MNNMVNYTYLVLRYMHDTTTGEFVNVGVVLYTPDSKYIGAKCRRTFKRISNLFLDINRDFLRKILKDVENSFSKINNQLSSITVDDEKTISDFARIIIPFDDSSLQWSPMGSGITNDPEKTLKKLYDRMVSKYDTKNEKDKKNDEDVWRSFKNNLDPCRVIENLKPVNISSNDDNVEFKHAWKNGKWHCLEPISFDLSHADTIKEKAYKWYGKISNIAESKEDFKVYFLVGEPENKSLRDPYYSAMKLLKKLPGDHRIIQEKDYKQFAEEFNKQVIAHETHPES